MCGRFLQEGYSRGGVGCFSWGSGVGTVLGDGVGGMQTFPALEDETLKRVFGQVQTIDGLPLFVNN